MRVLSLLPSATEMLACIVERQAVGRFGRVTLIGRSHECDFPQALVTGVPVLTSQKTQFNQSAENPAKDIDEQVRKALSSGNSLYNLDVDMVRQLNPDVVLTQSLCEVCSIDLVTVERVVHQMKSKAVVLDLNPKTLGEILTDIEKIGKVIGCEEGAQTVIDELQTRMDRVSKAEKRGPAPNVAFVEWTDPVFVGGHWTPEIITLAGGSHPLNIPGGKSVAVTDQAIADSDPDLLIIAPCGMNLEKTRELVEFIEKDPTRGEWFRSLRAVKNGKVVLVDGNEMFNRPGPRLIDALEFCGKLFSLNSKLGANEKITKELLDMPDFPWAPL